MKKVAEKNTGEKYASKGSMMKHEKAESKKTKIKEGEIKAPKKKIVNKKK